MARLVQALPFIAVFLVVFVANLAFNLREGRLAAPPRYDDVAYLADSITRVMFATEGGLFEYVASFVRNPPHSPLTSATAMLGFGLFGPSALSAYIANGWVLALYIYMLARISRPLGSTFDRVLFVAALTFVPVVHAMVTEFRPDLAAGLIFAIALGAISRFDVRGASPRLRVATAALAVLATIAKPSAIVLTIPALLAAFGLMLLSEGLFRKAGRGALIKGAAISFALYVAMLVPFAVIWGPRTFQYIVQALVTNADIWKTDGDRLFHASYHLFGVGGSLTLGIFGAIAFLIILADLALYALRRDYRERGVLVYYATLAIVYAAMAQSNEKTTFQGSFFYIPLILGAAAALVRMIVFARRNWPERNARGIRAAIVLAVLAELLFLPMSGAYTGTAFYGPQGLRTLDKVAEVMFAAHERNLFDPACQTHGFTFVATSPDPLAPDAVQFELAKVGVRVERASTFLGRSFEEAKKTLATADFVLMGDPSWTLFNHLPGEAFNPEIFRYLSEMKGARSVPVGEFAGRPLTLFILPGCAAGSDAKAG